MVQYPFQPHKSVCATCPHRLSCCVKGWEPLPTYEIDWTEEGCWQEHVLEESEYGSRGCTGYTPRGPRGWIGAPPTWGGK